MKNNATGITADQLISLAKEREYSIEFEGNKIRISNYYSSKYEECAQSNEHLRKKAESAQEFYSRVAKEWRWQ